MRSAGLRAASPLPELCSLLPSPDESRVDPGAQMPTRGARSGRTGKAAMAPWKPTVVPGADTVGTAPSRLHVSFSIISLGPPDNPGSGSRGGPCLRSRPGWLSQPFLGTLRHVSSDIFPGTQPHPALSRCARDSGLNKSQETSTGIGHGLATCNVLLSSIPSPSYCTQWTRQPQGLPSRASASEKQLQATP